MFDEFRKASFFYARSGEYTPLIRDLINHMQLNLGTDFRSTLLDSAFKKQIQKEMGSKENNTVQVIIKTLRNDINYQAKTLATNTVPKIHKRIRQTKLPKFDSYFQHLFTGLKISVNDIHAMKIELRKLTINSQGFSGELHFTAQDHFGLDSDDVRKWANRYQRIFGIWFVLQRYERFAFKPFFTNMKAVIPFNETRESR